MVTMVQYRGVCMSLLMLVDVMVCRSRLNKRSGKRAAVSVSFSKNLVSSSEGFDEVLDDSRAVSRAGSVLRLAKNFGFSLFCVWKVRAYCTETRLHSY